MTSGRFYQFGPFRLDAAGRLLFRGGDNVPLAPKVGETLLLLVENAGRVVEKEELLRKVWRGAFIEEGSLTRTISVLRKALGALSDGQEYVATISKRGYRFAAPVEELTHPAAVGAATRKMLAVLPFENLSRDKRQEYFSDGLTEEMISQLGSLDPERLGVIARTSAMQYKSTRKNIRKIGQELGVSFVLEGSVRRVGARVRIAAQLIQVSDQTHLWAEIYERDLGDILALQNAVAQAIVGQIEIELSSQGRARLKHSRQVNPRAYEEYLKGRYLWDKRTLVDLREAIKHFQNAILHDPALALAHSALADCYLVLASFPWVPPREAFPEAKKAAMRALEIDGSLAQARASLGYALCFHDRCWTEAEEEFRKAIRLNPNYATAHHWFSFHLAAMGRIPEAIEQMAKAEKLDPLSRIIKTNAGTALFWGRKFDAAVEQYRETLRLDPGFWIAHWMLGLAWEQKTQYRRAIQQQRLAIQHFPGKSPLLLASLARALALSGKIQQARKLLEKVHDLCGHDCAPFYHIAAAYQAIGDVNNAFRYLRKACEEREIWSAFLKVDPRMDSFRGDRRYQDLLRMVNLSD
jgi:TolB-like protein/Tfp pilus assembly protein PilF